MFFIIYYWTFTLSLHGKFPLGENDSASAFFYQRSRNRYYVNSTNCFPSLNFFGLKSFSFFKFLYQDESHWHHASFSLKVWLEKKDEQQLVRGVKHFFVLFLGKIPYLSSLLLSFSFIKRHSTVFTQIPWIALILYSRCYSTFLTMSDWKLSVFCVYRSRKGFPGISGTHPRLDLTEQVVAKGLSAKKWVFTLCIAYMKAVFSCFSSFWEASLKSRFRFIKVTQQILCKLLSVFRSHCYNKFTAMAPASLSEFCWFKIVLLLCVFRQGRVLMASCELVPAMFDPGTKQVIY